MYAADQFRLAIEQAGLTAPDAIIRDGKLHRFASIGDRADDSGWYVLFSDGLPAGAFGCWRLGLTQKWCAKPDRQMTATERADYRTRCEAARQLREAAERQRHAEAAAHARTIWEAAPLAAASHPYLQRKQVQPHGLRLDHDGDLIVPILIDGQLTSLQGIAAIDGQKMFLPGGQVKGGSFTFCELSSTPILIVEGFATGASVYEATGYSVVCAFFAGNLLPVAQAVRHQFPSAMIVLAGDNDVRTDGTTNTGLEAATAAAKSINGVLVIPEAINHAKTDWNDVHIHHGLVAVKEAIEMVLNREQARRAETARTDREPGLVKELSDEILRTDHFAQDGGGQLYVFEHGAYHPSGMEWIAQRVKSVLVATAIRNDGVAIEREKWWNLSGWTHRASGNVRQWIRSISSMAFWMFLLARYDRTIRHFSLPCNCL